MARSALPSIRCGIFGWTWSSGSLQRLGKPVTRDAAGIAVDRAERLIATRPVEVRSLDAHGVEIGSHCSKPPSLLLDRLDQCRSVTLSTKPLLDPEELDEQHAR